MASVGLFEGREVKKMRGFVVFTLHKVRTG